METKFVQGTDPYGKPTAYKRQKRHKFAAKAEFIEDTNPYNMLIIIHLEHRKTLYKTKMKCTQDKKKIFY